MKDKKILDKKVFIFDIDDTICDTDKCFIDLAHIFSFLDESVSLDDIVNRKHIYLSDCGLVTEKDESKIIKTLELFHIWENMEIFNGVESFLRKINSKGHYIVYLTKRHDYLRGQTSKWISNVGLPQPSAQGFFDMNQRVTLITQGKSKFNGLKNILDFHIGKEIYYFENDPDYVMKACELNIKNVYTFKYGYNRDVDFPLSVKVLSNPRDNCYVDLESKITL